MSLKIAIAIRGGVSKKIGRQFGPIASQSGLIEEYVNIVPCANSFAKHIVKPNENHEVDIYMHSWSVELQESLVNYYQPKHYIFESNQAYSDLIFNSVRASNKNRYRKSIYSSLRHFLKSKDQIKKQEAEDFSGISQAFAIGKAIDLVLKNESSARPYDAIFIYRPDLILLKDISFSEYDLNQITCNGMSENKGDFHFFVPRKFALDFSKLFESTYLGNFHEVHHWIRRYVVDYLKVPYGSDSIVAGLDQEVIRKVKVSGLKFDTITPYGMSMQDWDSIEH